MSPTLEDVAKLKQKQIYAILALDHTMETAMAHYAYIKRALGSLVSPRAGFTKVGQDYIL